MAGSLAQALTVVIEADDLPGRTFPRSDGGAYDNVHVGVQQRRDVVDLVPGDAPAATWRLELTLRPGASRPFGGPYVHGRNAEQFIYLSWGALSDGAFEMFRRAKLRLDLVPPSVIESLVADGGPFVGALHARLGLTAADGGPLCASVRPPGITWAARRG